MITIKKIRIKNFRSIVDETIDLTDINFFVGKNDCGKSNVLKALNLFFNDQTDFLCDFNFPYYIISPFSIIFTYIKSPYINEGYEQKQVEDDIKKVDYLILAILFWILSFAPIGDNMSNAINIAIISVSLFMSKKVEKLFFGIKGLLHL